MIELKLLMKRKIKLRLFYVKYYEKIYNGENCILCYDILIFLIFGMIIVLCQNRTIGYYKINKNLMWGRRANIHDVF